MKPELLAVLIAAFALISQGLNVYLSLRIENKMLQQRQELLEECDGRYAGERETNRRLVSLERHHAA